jgi:hypothetical protein
MLRKYRGRILWLRDYPTAFLAPTTTILFIDTFGVEERIPGGKLQTSY